MKSPKKKKVPSQCIREKISTAHQTGRNRSKEKRRESVQVGDSVLKTLRK